MIADYHENTITTILNMNTRICIYIYIYTLCLLYLNIIIPKVNLMKNKTRREIKIH